MQAWSVFYLSTRPIREKREGSENHLSSLVGMHQGHFSALAVSWPTSLLACLLPSHNNRDGIEKCSGEANLSAQCARVALRLRTSRLFWPSFAFAKPHRKMRNWWVNEQAHNQEEIPYGKETSSSTSNSARDTFSLSDHLPNMWEPNADGTSQPPDGDNLTRSHVVNPHLKVYRCRNTA